MITLVYTNGRYLTFSARDYIVLRKDHRIVGSLVGVHVKKAYDNTIKGLPAVYTDLEVRVLIDEGVVCVRKTPGGGDTAIQDSYKAYMNAVTEQLNGRVLFQIPTECPYAQNNGDDLPQPCPDPLKLAVYRDLRQRKFVITGGNSFGGDFLIYPQDPIVCHASHIVQVLPTATMTAKDFVQANRLAVGVRKDCLLAYQNPDQEIVYHKSRWDSSWCS